MKSRAEIVIIGAGVNGLSIAYRLAEKGISDIVVLEQGYIGFGASGRSAGSITQQWDDKELIILAKESLKTYQGLAADLNYNIFFRQDGYLRLAQNEDEVKALKKSVGLQNSLGVRSRYLELGEVKDLVPHINTKRVLGASYCTEDGAVFPFPVLWGYEKTATGMGVEINDFTKVTGFKVKGGEIKAVQTNQGSIETSTVVNAAGAYSRRIAKMMEIELPNRPFKYEALVTEPLKPLLNPVISTFNNDFWLYQTVAGELIGGLKTLENSGYTLTGSIDFLKRFARETVNLIPSSRYLNVLRQWAGICDITPDEKPLLGEPKEVKGFIQANGFSGHGFMYSAVVAKLVAEFIVDGKTSLPLDSFSPNRFKKREPPISSASQSH